MLPEMIHSLLKMFRRKSSVYIGNYQKNVVSLASKAFREDQLDLKCTNANMTEKNALHTSCNARDITSFFSPKFIFQYSTQMIGRQ